MSLFLNCLLILCSRRTICKYFPLLRPYKKAVTSNLLLGYLKRSNFAKLYTVRCLIMY